MFPTFSTLRDIQTLSLDHKRKQEDSGWGLGVRLGVRGAGRRTAMRFKKVFLKEVEFKLDPEK